MLQTHLSLLKRNFDMDSRTSLGGQDFPGQQDGRTFMEQRTSLNRTSLNGRTSLDGRPLLRTWLKGVCWRMQRCTAPYVCKNVKLCV